MKITKLIKAFSHQFGIEISKYYPENYSWIKEANINSIIDIGANVGQFAIKIGRHIPQAEIISFEPIKECYLKLIENTKGLNIKVFHCALGAHEYSTNIHISSHSPSSSLLEMDKLHKELFTHTAKFKEEVIEIKTLDKVINPENLKKNILIKIDVQGFEAEVLKGGLNVINMAKIIIIEVNYYQLYKNQTCFDEIYEILRQLNFRFIGNLNQTFNYNKGNIIYSDAIFIKD